MNKQNSTRKPSAPLNTSLTRSGEHSALESRSGHKEPERHN
jgi:hypothetical protein